MEIKYRAHFKINQFVLIIGLLKKILMVFPFFAWNLWLILKIPITLIVLVILFVVYRFGISVWLQKKRMVVPGVTYVRLMGMNLVKEMKMLLDKHGDAMFPVKDAIKKNPDSKAFVIQVGPFLCLILTDSEYIKEFNNKIIVDYDRLQAQLVFDVLVKNGIVALTGEEWKLHRKILSDSFRFDLFEKNIFENYTATVEFFQNLSPQEMEGFLPRDQLKRVFSAITGQNFFGENVDKRMLEGKSALVYLFELFEEIGKVRINPIMMLPLPEAVKRKIVPSYRRFIVRARKFKDLMLKIIQETRERIESNPNLKGRNIIEGLLEAQKQHKNHSTLDDESIAGEFITLLFAGTDTTSCLLTFTLYHLAIDPDLVKELLDEIHHAIPGGKVTSINQLNNLELMHSTLKEVLRLYPPVGFTAKEAIRDTRILDLKVKKGDSVGIAIQANNYNPKYWEDPEKFNPKRFMKGIISPHMEPFAFLSFSAGMRNCIGQHFAMIQAKLVLTVFLMTFDFKLVPDYKMKVGFKVLYEPMDPLKLILTKKT